MARQALEHRSRQLLPRLNAAFDRGDERTFRALAALWLKLMRLTDDVVGTHSAFLLGPWVHDARRAATDDDERAEFERTAKVLLTVWGTRDASDEGNLHDYANRSWHGLVADFHLPRWRAWLDELADALREGRDPVPVDWFAVEEPWSRERKDYPLRPVGDPYRTAARVRDVLATAPYQGRVELTVEPPVVEPGGRTRLTATFVNVNGLAGTGPVELTLDGLDAEPEDGSTLPGIPAAGSGTLAWRVNAPATPLDRPLRPRPYTLTFRYGPRGTEPVPDVESATLYEGHAPSAGWRTVNTNEAVFGQLDDRFAIDGAGSDLWKNVNEFGALYREAALKDGGRLTVRVDAQPATAPWARAGIVVRNSLATEDSLGFVNLAVTPANGVALSHDSTGDGTLDTYQRLAGVRAPVLLRLTRSGATYAGECSTDDGATWETVATAEVPGVAAAQDAGMFMTAANAEGVHGLVEFSGWRGEEDTEAE